MFLKKEDIFNFNVDEIEVYGTFSNYKELFKGINDSNSDYITFGEFTLKMSDKLRDYEFKVDFWKNNFPCFAFYVGKKLNEFITTRDYFKVYGSAFQLIELNEIIDFIDTYILLDSKDRDRGLKKNTLKRVDLAMDLKKNIVNDIFPNFGKLKQKGTQYFGNGGKLETYYIGEYKKRLNKAFLIRIYNKVVDIKGKGKQQLYPHYLLEKDITRIEIEFRTDVLKYLDIHRLLDRSYIFDLFIMYIEKHTKLFKKIKQRDVEKLKRLNKKVKIEDLKADKVLKDRYLKAFLGYGKNILKTGICPVDILIKNSIISDFTKSNIPLGIDGEKFDELKYMNKFAKKYCPNPFENFFDENPGKS